MLAPCDSEQSSRTPDCRDGREAVDELAYWVGFNKVLGIGPARLRALLDFFGGIEAAWHGDLTSLQHAGLDKRSVSKSARHAQVTRSGRRAAALRSGRRQGADVGLRGVPNQPSQHPRSSPVLYVKGELLPEDDWAVAVVGRVMPASMAKKHHGVWPPTWHGTASRWSAAWQPASTRLPITRRSKQVVAR